MKRTIAAFRFSDVRAIRVMRNLPILHLGVLGLMAIFFTGAAANNALAQAKKSKAPPALEVQVSYIDEEEEKTYQAAKQESDPRKRAVKLLEFLDKYPKSELLKQADYDDLKLIEAEHNAFHAAAHEPDFQKRASMLIEFEQKYPASMLIGNAENEYLNMLKELSRGKKYDLLESIGEQWLKLHPRSRETYAYIAEATMNLKKYDRCVECLEAIYKMEPLPSLAKEILNIYQKTENLAQQIEWSEKLFKMPEFADDYMLRYEFVIKFSKSNNLSKAAEYAQLTLKSADLVKQQDAKTRQHLQQVRRACHHVIGSSLMEKGKYAEAILALKAAIKTERYAEGYYKIGQCLESQKQIEEAALYYAAAELIGGEDASKAKARLKVLYKALHNDTLIGIDKVYKKAKDLLAEPNT